MNYQKGEMINYEGHDINLDLIELIYRSVLDGSDFVWKLEYEKYSLKSWMELVGYVDTNQAFFTPLLPVIGTQTHALVIDDALASLPIALSRNAGSVTYIVLCRSKLEFCKQLFKRLGVLNIKVMMLDELESVDEPINLLVALRPSRLGLTNPEQITRMLTSECTIWVMDRNKYSLKVLWEGIREKNKGQKERLGKQDWLLHSNCADYEIENFVTNHDSINGYFPRPAVMKAGNFSVHYYGSRLKERLKKFVLNLQAMTIFLPGYAIRGIDREKSSWLNQAAIASSLKEKFNAKNFTVQRLFSGNRGVSVVFVTFGEIETVWRISAQESGIERIKQNAKSLRWLSQHPDAIDVVPTLHFEGEIDGTYFSVEQKLNCYEPDPARKDLIRLAEIKGLNWFCKLQAKMVVRKQFNEQDFDELVLPHILGLSKFGNLKSAHVIQRSKVLLRSALIDKEVDFVPIHGDLKGGNVLFDKQGKVSGIIDWDMSSARALPLMDFFIQATYREMHTLEGAEEPVLGGFVQKFISGVYDKEYQRFCIPNECMDKKMVNVTVLLIALRIVDIQLTDSIKMHQPTFTKIVENSIAKLNNHLALS